MKCNHEVFAAVFLLCFSPCLFAAGLDELRSDVPWQPVAHGVWQAELGNMSAEVRYTDLAAAPPKLERLNSLPATPFPFRERPIRYRRLPDHRVAVHIPTSTTEQIFGYGLPFDGTQKNGQILELKVDHFNRSGRRHAH